MPTMNVPLVGEVEQKYVYAGGAVIAGILGYAYWTKSRTSNQSEEYLVPIDELVQTGSSSTPGLPAANTPVPDPDTLPPGTADEWSRRVTAQLAELGYDPVFVSTTLGKYLGRQDLTQAEADLIRTAIAMVGYVPGTETYPIKVAKPAPTPEPEPEKPATQPTQPTQPTQRIYTLPSAMTVKEACKAIYGSYQWNGNGGRLYYANEGVIVGAARAAGVWKDYADFKMPAGTTLVVP